MAGRFDLAGVGHRDPQLITIKTIRAIKACQVLVLPIGRPELKKPELEEGEEETFAKECLAYRIACEAEPETKKKLRLYLPMPMIKEKKLLKEIHDAGARKASELLEKGKNLVFLTIGDPTVYSTGIGISGGDLFRDSVFLCCGSKAGDLACGEPAGAACSSGVLWN